MRHQARVLAGVVVASFVGVSCGDERGVQVGAAEVVGVAFAETADASTYRVTQSVAQTISSTPLGIDTQNEIDVDNPTLIGEVSPERSHYELQAAPVLEPFIGDIGPLGTEMWIDADRLVIDTRSYQRIRDLNPNVELGPLEPGVAFIDLTATEADRSDLVGALTGSGDLDLDVMAARLPDALSDVERASDRARVFTGSASYAVFVEAVGGDIDQAARATAALFALNLAVDADALAEVYIEFYRDTAVDVTVELDEAGFVSVISTRADLSAIFGYVFESGNTFGLDLSDAELAAAEDAFADSVWIVESRISYEPDEHLIVEPAPDSSDDRTAEWREFLIASGMLGN